MPLLIIQYGAKYNNIMKYLVTGGTGFIGSNIAKALLEKSAEVYVTGFERENIPKGAIYLGTSFVDIDWQALPKIDAVFHEAANNDTTITDETLMLRENFTNSITLFENAYKEALNAQS